MEKEKLGQVISTLFPELGINIEMNPIRIKADSQSIHALVSVLKNDNRLQFDYLYNLYGVDYSDRFTILYYFESTSLNHHVSVEVDLVDHENPVIETISDLYRTAEFQEREVYDLMGVTFTNHPDPRRLFLEDGWGFPLRKDYKDDINFIER